MAKRHVYKSWSASDIKGVTLASGFRTEAEAKMWLRAHPDRKGIKVSPVVEYLSCKKQESGDRDTFCVACVKRVPLA